MTRIDWQAVLGMGVLLMASGCVTNATTELTEAPFVATSDITNGTTAAVADITGAVTDFTSSTTPGAVGSHNPAWVKQRLENFTKASHENLRADISRWYGEYLVSLATLAGVPSAQFPAFRRFGPRLRCRPESTYRAPLNQRLFGIIQGFTRGFPHLYAAFWCPKLLFFF